MFRYLTVLIILVGFFVLSVCQAEINEIRKSYEVIQEQTSNVITTGAKGIPHLNGITPNTVVGCIYPRAFSLFGGGFDNNIRVEIVASGVDKILDKKNVTVIDSENLKIRINTMNDSDNWAIRVSNENGHFSNTVNFTVTGVPISVPIGELGSVIGKFGVIEAKSNGDCTGKSIGTCDTNYLCEAPYQCVDYAKRYYKQNYPSITEIDSQWGSAKKFWERSKHSKLTKSIYPKGDGLKKDGLPHTGDMIFFDTGHPSGHVAIVTLVNDNEISIIQQNINRKSAYGSLKIVKDSITGLMSINSLNGSMPVLGWLAPPANTEHNLPLPLGPSELSFSSISALVLDHSGSMDDPATHPDGTIIKPKTKKLERALQATNAFIRAMNDNDGISFSTFSTDATTEISLNSVQKIKQTLNDTLDSVRAGGGTNIGAGLEKAALELQQSGDESLLLSLLLSDGENNEAYNEYLWKMVKKFKENNWPICTIGFGKEAGEQTLIKIAGMTGCTYVYAESTDIGSKYQELAAYAKAKSVTLSAKDLLAEKGQLVYDFFVNQKAKILSFFTNWQGSMLKTVLIAPDGSRIEDTSISPDQGRYVEGKTFQMLEIKNPVPGKWRVELSWKEAPPSPEQVNILVTEKTDVFARIHGLKSQYTLGQTVDINTDAFEVVNNRKVPLKNATVKIEVKKPGEEVIRLIQAQSTSWTMYKDVLADIRRDVSMFDDGAHKDYHPQDGIFGGSFTETDKNSVYLVTATITGQKQNGEKIQKTIINTFQVGSIMNNPVSTSQTLHYIQQAEESFDNTTPVSTDLLNQPVEEIDLLQQGSDPLDEINQLLQ